MNILSANQVFEAIHVLSINFIGVLLSPCKIVAHINSFNGSLNTHTKGQKAGFKAAVNWLDK